MKEFQFVALVFCAAAFIVLAASCSDPQRPRLSDKFENRVYFKSDVRDRIFVYQAKTIVSEPEALQFAQSKMHTQGQMTAVYIYDPGAIAPGNSLNSENSLFRVNDILYKSKHIDSWRYAYMKGRNGLVVFVDRKRDKNHSLCR